MNVDDDDHDDDDDDDDDDEDIGKKMYNNENAARHIAEYVS